MKTVKTMKITQNTFRSILLILAIALSAFSLAANNENGALESIFDHLKQEEVLLAELEVDFGLLESNRKNNDYQTARFSFTSSNGIAQNWNVEVRARGRFRRVTCEMPPLRLRFSKKELSANGLQKHNSFKLVTHCMEGAEGNDLIFREYLTYQMYSQLTDHSFRTQLVQITYLDSQSKKKRTQYGILIEDTDLMAERLNGVVCKACYGLEKERFESSNAKLHALFQYMVGNTDWSTRMIRNLKLLSTKENGKMLAIPYDFDFSGLVNASYAIPNKDYDLKSVRERYFLGQVATTEELQPTIQYFLSQQQALIELVNNFELLSKKSRKDMVQYLESFFEEVENNEQGISNRE